MNWLQLFAGRPNTLRAPQGSPSTAQGGRHTPPERDQIVHAVQPVQPVPQIQTRSISPKEIASQLNNLKNELNKASPRIKLERVCRYLPEGVLFTTVTRERLKLVVPNAGKDLIEFILRDALKLFVITINSIPASDVIEAMGQFKLHGLIDAHLPLDDIDQICAAEPTLGIPPLYGSGIEPLCNSHDRAIDAFHHWPWESSNRDSFYDFQWRLLVPKFSMERLERFETNRILPILKRDAKSVGGGHFSQVYKAKLLADYQDHFTVHVDQITIAIKEMKNLEEHSYDVEKEWRREADAMKEFNSLGHRHVTRAIAAYTQNQKYYLVLEWADGGNLRDFWLENPHPQLTEEKIKEFIDQLWGLTDAIDRIHNSTRTALLRTRTAVEPSSPASSSTDHSSNVPALQLNGVNSFNEQPVASAKQDFAIIHEVPSIPVVIEPPTGSGPQRPSISGISDNWRHGDLKPDNILVFREPNMWIGTLKLADLGRAKKHQFLTHIRKAATDERWSTRQYEPPEAFTASRKARSRLWDIWSMGCIMFESVLWLLYGDEVQHNVATETTQETPIGTIYWAPDGMLTNNKTARVNELTTKCMYDMMTNDPECQPGTAIGDLLALIKDELLVVKLPTAQGFEPGCRANATRLHERLTMIRNKASREPSYMLKVKNRDGVKAPTSHQQPVAASVNGTAATNKGASKYGSLLGTPSQSGSSKRDTYSHAFQDVWECIHDDSFAQQLLEQPAVNLEPLPSTTLCQRCQSFEFYSSTFKFKVKLSELRAKATNCGLCTLFASSLIKRQVPEAAVVEIDQANSGLRLNGSGPPILSICRTVQLPHSIAPELYTRMGLPSLPKAGSLLQFEVLRHWLRDCDNNHGKSKSNCLSQGDFVLPTRLIDVGLDKNCRTVHLLKKDALETRLEESGKKILQYAAFSHPWGRKEDGHTHFVATRDNLEQFNTTGISVNELPRTFKDAIRISQGLGIRYIWIDSLCILQGPTGDFAVESKLMDAVFQSAYCVIAAASARGTSSEVISRPAPPDPIVIAVEKYGTSHSLFIREPLEDFQADVLDGPLSKRGWVLQERALARRTIYFTNKQVYMECADGIRCETLMKMRNSEVAFLGDSNFPKYALKSSKGGQIFLYQSLYAQYSTLDFSYPADRSVALLGLEQRLARAFDDHGEHGIFKTPGRLERSLMWRRGLDGQGKQVKQLVRIKQKVTDHDRGRSSPTWSWMAYEGGIGFIKPRGGSLDWEPKPRGISWLTGDDKGNLRLRGLARDFELAVPNDMLNADIIWDAGDKPEKEILKCVVLGKDTDKEQLVVNLKKNYVLIIAKKVSASKEVLYERVGVGFLLGKFLKAGEEEDVFVV